MPRSPLSLTIPGMTGRALADVLTRPGHRTADRVRLTIEADPMGLLVEIGAGVDVATYLLDPVGDIGIPNPDPDPDNPAADWLPESEAT